MMVGSDSSSSSSSSVSPQPVMTPESSEADVEDDNDNDGDVDGIELQPLQRRRQSLLYTADEERAVVRQFDRRLVLFVALLYLLSFLDRSNIGNARVAGMDADLQTVPPRADWYAWALSAFYAAYLAFGWLALLWRVVPAHVFVAVLVAGWGTAAALQAVAGAYPWLVVLRAVLGGCEAGFAGIPLYLARFFRRDELATRTGVFLAAAPLATSFAASLAWAILAVGQSVVGGGGDGDGGGGVGVGIAPWRLLFLVEGFPSVVAGVVAWRVLPDAPETARYLKRRQRRVAVLRLKEDGDEDDDDDRQAVSLPLLLDPLAWLTAAMFFLANMAYSSLPVFLPTILAAMGYETGTAQALAAPPFLVATAVVLATARLSDRLRARAPLLIAHALVSAAGYAVLSVDGGVSHTARYMAVFPAAAGFFSVVVLLIAWNLNNQRGARRQGRAFALFQVVGQCGPLVGTRLYPDGDAPLFLRGMRAMAGAMVGVAVLAGVLRAVLRRRNAQLREIEEKKKDEAEAEAEGEGEREGGEAEALVSRQGEESLRRHRRKASSFRYML